MRQEGYLGLVYIQMALPSWLRSASVILDEKGMVHSFILHDALCTERPQERPVSAHG